VPVPQAVAEAVWLTLGEGDTVAVTQPEALVDGEAVGDAEAQPDAETVPVAQPDADCVGDTEGLEEGDWLTLWVCDRVPDTVLQMVGEALALPVVDSDPQVVGLPEGVPVGDTEPLEERV
jgi:hypothetical protein